MSKYQKHLDNEVEIVLALKEGRIKHSELNTPDNHIETGLAHVFFFGDSVFKHYKLEGDEEHFIKGLLAPTERRHEFIKHDFALNKHFGGGVYKQLHSHHHDGEVVVLGEYTNDHPYVLIEMDKLDFSNNLHELLLQKKISKEALYKLGYFTAKSISEVTVTVPDSVNWYELANNRIDFLELFVDWLPENFSTAMKNIEYVSTLRIYLEAKREAYEEIKGSRLSVSLDNHDENVFFKNGEPLFIDVVPPMSSWWYGVPVINLANLVVNIETLVGEKEAGEVERGYMEFHNLEKLPDEYLFTKALAFGISVAHFGSLEDKKEIAEKYIAKCRAIKERLF